MFLLQTNIQDPSRYLRESFFCKNRQQLQAANCFQASTLFLFHLDVDFPVFRPKKCTLKFHEFISGEAYFREKGNTKEWIGLYSEIIFILIYSGAEIARVRKGFSHTLFLQVNPKSATITQSAETTIPPNAPRLSRSNINGELYPYIYLYIEREYIHL